ncbi:MAG: hypothetical protein ABFD03_01835, partial [Clostridiaceae bacterium]
MKKDFSGQEGIQRGGRPPRFSAQNTDRFWIPVKKYFARAVAQRRITRYNRMRVWQKMPILGVLRLFAG